MMVRPPEKRNAANAASADLRPAAPDHASHPPPANPAPESPATDALGLPLGQTLSNASGLLQQIILICGRRDQGWHDAWEWISDAGGVAMVVGERRFADEWLESYADSFGAIFLDCDHIGDSDEVIELTLTLRRVAPAVPILLCSRHFSRHSLEVARGALCDASLKLPLNRSALFLGLGAAVENNRKFRD